MFPPSRIVCLTEETRRDAVFAWRARSHRRDLRLCRAQARREKPRVSAFTSANIGKILALKPDLVLTFSDLQADIVADLIRRGLDVHAFNQRSIAGILDMIRTLGAMVDANERARQLVETLETRLAEVRSRAAVTEAPKGILRGMGRSVDLRNWMGIGARRDRRRHRHFRRSSK
jgi:iron complex transport system substrate-binding protein